MRLRYWIIAYFLLAAVLYACVSRAEEIAVTCIYSGGNLIFASHLNAGEKELNRIFPTDDGTVSLKMTQFDQRFFNMNLEFVENGKFVTRSARCALEREK